VLDEPLELKRKLDTDDRKRTRVLGKLDPEERNWTLVWPETPLAGNKTLVRVRIQAGARHQIRAHLAAANLPIVGDPLYGDMPGDMANATPGAGAEESAGGEGGRLVSAPPAAGVSRLLRQVRSALAEGAGARGDGETRTFRRRAGIEEAP